MNTSQIGTRYAKALYLLGVEKGIAEKIYADIQDLHTVMQESDDFKEFLKNPAIKSSMKKETISTLFASSYTKETISLMHLLVSNSREAHLIYICLAFLALYRKNNKIARTKITTSIQLSQSELKELSTSIEKRLNKKLEIENYVEPSIIGGAIIQLDDLLFDASFARSLKNIKEKLQKIEF